MKVSLLIATYNWPEALALCLKSVARQQVPPFEVVIADDGSGEPTRRVIEEFSRTLPCPVKHIWHEDDGFRLTIIRNKAIAACEGDYIVQIDGDVILHRNFIRDHAAFAEKNAFVTGSRAMIDERLAQKMLRNGNPQVAWYTRGVKHWLNALYLPAWMSVYKHRRDDHIRGCNMAFWRDDLLRVNGYNEDLLQWGHEDGELAFRLHFAGVRKKALKMGGNVYHLYHPESDRGNEQRHLDELERVKREHLAWCEHGIDQYLKQEK